MTGDGARGLLRKTLHTFATLAFSQGASVAAGIATARAFGPGGKGIISFAAIVLTFAVTTADGLKSAVAYQIGSERRDARAVWHAALRLAALCAIVGTTTLLSLWHGDPEKIAFLFAACAFPFALYLQAVGVIYQLRDRIERINVKNASTIGGGGALAILALVVVAHAPLAFVLGTWVATYVVAAVWSSFGVRAMLADAPSPHADEDAVARRRSVTGAPDADEGALARRQAAFGAKAALSSTVTFLALRVDVFIVGAMLSPNALGIYTLALATGEIMWGVSRALQWSSAGRVAMLDASDAAHLTARLVRSIVALQAMGAVVVFALGPWLIAHVYGARFAEAGSVLRLLLPGMILYSADGLLSYFISVRAARPGLLLGLECVTLGVCAAVTLATIGTFGIRGAAIADTVAYVCAYAVKVAIFTRLTGIPSREVLVPVASDVPARLAVVLAGLGLRRRPADV